MKSFIHAEDRQSVMARLGRLRADSPRQWGRMNAHQMVCHLSDSFRLSMGEKSGSSAGGILDRTVVKWFALYAPTPWPKGVQTRPEVDQEIGGTSPVDFQQDVVQLIKLVERFTQAEKDFDWQWHPSFGEMSERQWMRWGYLHMDHHLRQFGA